MNKNNHSINDSLLEYHFWEDCIKRKSVEEMLFGNINNSKITKQTLFMYIGLLDTDKDIFKSGWSAHKDLNNMIGYLLHLFFPLAYYNWIDRKSEGFFIPIAPFYIVKEEVMNTIDSRQRQYDELRYGQPIEAFRTQVEKLYDMNREAALKALQEVCREFNELFDDFKSRKIFIRIFGDSEEIVSFILGDGEDYFEEVIEEEIGMSVLELRGLCHKVYEEPLINRTFIGHLNQKVSMWF